MEDLECPNCKDSFEELYSKGLFNRNKDNTYYCIDCYKEVHGAEFE